jgi:hypothetical protein
VQRVSVVRTSSPQGPLLSARTTSMRAPGGGASRILANIQLLAYDWYMLAQLSTWNAHS